MTRWEQKDVSIKAKLKKFAIAAVFGLLLCAFLGAGAAIGHQVDGEFGAYAGILVVLILFRVFSRLLAEWMRK